MSAESRESAEPINVANLRINQRSQINEDTVEPSLAAQDISLKLIAYAPDLISKKKTQQMLFTTMGVCRGPENVSDADVPLP